jgi:hypothetical protein
MSVRKVSEALKKLIAGRQNYKCANMLNSDIVKNYNCPLWENKERNGSFGEEGYQIDHIVEHSISKNDAPENLQALCLSCHSVKTKRFMILFEKKQEDEKNNEKIYDVEEIIDKRKIKNKTEYLIKWKGYNFSECTWEPKENIFSKKMIKNFEKQFKVLNQFGK